MEEIKLGSEVRDPITGYKGIAVGRTIWLHGCARISVQKKGVDNNGKLFEMQSFDEPQLIVINKKKEKEGNHNTGGPRPNLQQKETIGLKVNFTKK